MARQRVWAVLLWVAVFVAASAVLRISRQGTDTAHAVLTYLLIVLGGSVSGGRPLGLALTVGGFLLIDFFFQLPYDTLKVSRPFDWIVLFSFVTTAVVTTQLLAQQKARAAEAERRAGEVAWLGRMGAEILTAGRAEDSLSGIAELIRSSLGVGQCRIYGRDEEGERLLVVSPATPDGRPPEPAPDTLTIVAELRAHGRVVGVVHLSDAQAIELDPARQRFLDALAYYAALAVERMRLVATAERAEALREADRLKDVVLASVSHDLRTPLTTIKALAEEAVLKGDPNARAIAEQADRLGHLVADLLDLSRLKGGALPVHPELNTAEDLVGAVMRQLAGLLKDRTVETKVDFTEPALVGRFDFVQSLRILSNLLENAVRYSPREAPIELAVERGEGGAELVFRVADRGPGIALAERERVFEPFYRPPGAPADTGGAGLGLAIARRLAELQGGSLEYVPRPGGGSQFLLRLPAETTTDIFVKS